MSETVDAARLLRRLRQDRGQSLRAAAGDLGVAASHLSRLERGEKSPSDDLIRRAAQYYGLDNDLVTLESGRVPPDIIDILRSRPELMGELRAKYGESAP